MVGQGAFNAEERREATAGRSPSPTPSGAMTVERRWPPTRVSLVGMASLEGANILTFWKLVMRTILYFGYTASTTIRAGRTSPTT